MTSTEKTQFMNLISGNPAMTDEAPRMRDYEEGKFETEARPPLDEDFHPTAEEADAIAELAEQQRAAEVDSRLTNLVTVEQAYLEQLRDEARKWREHLAISVPAASAQAYVQSACIMTVGTEHMAIYASDVEALIPILGRMRLADCVRGNKDKSDPRDKFVLRRLPPNVVLHVNPLLVEPSDD